MSNCLTPAWYKKEGFLLCDYAHPFFFPRPQTFQSCFASPLVYPPSIFWEHVKIIYYMYLPILVTANIKKKKDRCCMNLRICWRTLDYPRGEVLFKIFSYQTETVTSLSDLLPADITQRLCKGNPTDSSTNRTGYQSITKNFIKWNLSRKPWQARNHPFISVCQLMSYVDSMFFFPFLSYPSSEQINHIPSPYLDRGQ